MVKGVIDQLIKKGKVVRGWIGVTIQELTPEIAQKFGMKNAEGVLITDITRGGPAHNAGLMRGDVILEFNDKVIKDASLLRNMVAQSEINKPIKLKIFRQGQEMTITLAVKELSSDEVQMIPSSSSGENFNSDSHALSGITVMDINPAISKQLGIQGDERGVVIVKMQPGSLAEESGIRKGDVIQEMDRQKINNLNDFNKAISHLKSNSSVLLFINRGGKKYYVTLNHSR